MCKMVMAFVGAFNPAEIFIARLRVEGSKNLPLPGSPYYVQLQSNVVRFEGLADNKYELGISKVLPSGRETEIVWEAVGDSLLPKPSISSSNSGTTVSFTWSLLSDITELEYRIDYGSWNKLQANVTNVNIVGVQGLPILFQLRSIKGMIAGTIINAAHTYPLSTTGYVRLDRIFSYSEAGRFMYAINRITIGSPLKAVGSNYTLTITDGLGASYNVSQVTVDSNSTPESIAAALARPFQIKGQGSANGYGFADIVDSSNSLSLSLT